MARRKTTTGPAETNSPESEAQDVQAETNDTEQAQDPAEGETTGTDPTPPTDPDTHALSLMEEAAHTLERAYPPKGRPQLVADALRKLGTAQRWLGQHRAR